MPERAPSIHIRPERAADAPAIRHIITAAFARDDEADLVHALRHGDDDLLSLVAEVDGVPVGHIAFSRMTAPFAALALAPVAVAPERQRRGIGARLIEHGLDLARSRGEHAVFVLGEPAYYGRFGFRADLAAGFSSPYAGRNFMVLPLAVTSGRVDHAPAFAAL